MGLGCGAWGPFTPLQAGSAGAQLHRGACEQSAAHSAALAHGSSTPAEDF